MIDLAYVFATLACLPLVVMVIWAFVTRHPRHSTEKLLIFRNRVVAISVFIILFFALVVFIAWQAYELGGCHGGLFSTARCSHLPNRIGDAVFNIHFVGAIYLVVACLPALLLLGGVEFLTRRKHKLSLTSDGAGQ